jgi:hypothetical protein
MATAENPGAPAIVKSTLPPRLAIFGSSKNQEKPSGSTRTCLEHAYNSSLAATITIHVGFNSQIEGMISEPPLAHEPRAEEQKAGALMLASKSCSSP